MDQAHAAGDCSASEEVPFDPTSTLRSEDGRWTLAAETVQRSDNRFSVQALDGARWAMPEAVPPELWISSPPFF